MFEPNKITKKYAPLRLCAFARVKYTLLIGVFILFTINLHSQNFLFPRVTQNLSGVTSTAFPQNFDVAWNFKTGSEIKSTPLIVDNKIIVSSTDAHLYCLDLSGELQWKFNADNAFEASPMVYKGVIYIGDLSGKLYAISLNDGSRRWEYETGNQIMATANWYVDGSNTYILVGSYDYSLHCVNAQSGDSLWTYELDNFLNGAVAIENGLAVFGGCDGFLHCVDIKSGKLQSKYDVATYIASSPVLENDIAYIGDYDGIFMAVDLKAQKTLWQYDPKESNLPFIGSPAVFDDKVISTNRDKHVYCFNKTDGKLLWKKSTGFKVDASPIISNAGKVLAVNMRGDILIFDIETGAILTEYELGSPVFSNPAVNAKAIVLGANDGNVYLMK